MSRPCTDLPITRVSVTNDGATDVVVAGVVLDVELVEVVDVEVVVVAVDVVVVELAAGSPVVEAVVADAVVVDCPSDVDEQATISWEMTRGATHHGLVLIGIRGSAGCDDHAAIAVRDLLALDHSTDFGQELRDVAHE